MDATCNVQDSIHVFHLVHNMCPGFWVHINFTKGYFFYAIFHFWANQLEKARNRSATCS